jgi:nicotinamidase-related amidase
MHKIEIPKFILDRVRARRPNLTLFPELDARATALIVVDLQNAFMLPGMPGDLVVEKNRFSAFIQGSSSLDEQLRAAGIDTVIVTGTVTNTCCESTARDAMMLNYKTVFVSDANACRTDEEHNASLGNIMRIFGDVATTDEVIGRLK